MSKVEGIPWMMIGSADEAAAFARAVLSVAKPGNRKPTPFDAGMKLAVAAFGSETGNPDNGFKSALQVIEVAGATDPKGAAPASTAALAAGVDQVNAITVGKRAEKLESYYAQNVIGGEVGGIAAGMASSAIDEGLASVLTKPLYAPIQISAQTSTAILILSSMMVWMLGGRRRVRSGS